MSIIKNLTGVDIKDRDAGLLIGAATVLFAINEYLQFTNAAKTAANVGTAISSVAQNTATKVNSAENAISDAIVAGKNVGTDIVASIIGTASSAINAAVKKVRAGITINV